MSPDRTGAPRKEQLMFAIIGHLIVTAFRAFWRILITTIIAALVGAGAVLTAIYVTSGQVQWPPRDQMQLVTLIGVTALAAYAGGVTALMVEAVRALKEATRVAEKEIVAPLEAAGRELRGDKS
jgi:hypothetical protein